MCWVDEPKQRALIRICPLTEKCKRTGLSVSVHYVFPTFCFLVLVSSASIFITQVFLYILLISFAPTTHPYNTLLYYFCMFWFRSLQAHGPVFIFILLFHYFFLRDMYICNFNLLFNLHQSLNFISLRSTSQHACSTTLILKSVSKNKLVLKNFTLSNS